MMTPAINPVAKLVLLLTVLVCCVASLGDCGTSGWYGAHYDSDVSGEVKVSNEDIRIIDPAEMLYTTPPYIQITLTPTGKMYFGKTYVVTVKSREKTYGVDSVVWNREDSTLGFEGTRSTRFSISRDDWVFVEWVGEQAKGGSAPYKLLRVEVSSRYPEPIVVTNEVADVTHESATLRGTLTALGKDSSVTVSFRWGKATQDYPMKLPAW